MNAVAVLIVCLRVHAALATSDGQRGSIPQFAGPIKVVGKQIGVCPPEMRGTNQYRFTDAIIKQTRDKPFPRVFTNIEALGPFGDNIQAFLSMASWSRVSGWAPNAVNFVFRKFCSDTRAFYRDLVDTIEKHIDADHKLCPHPAAKNITINGAPAFFIPNRKLVVAFPYGRWRVDVRLKQDDTFVGCMRIFVDTVPLLESKPGSSSGSTP